jgi:hypothetical protein
LKIDLQKNAKICQKGRKPTKIWHKNAKISKFGTKTQTFDEKTQNFPVTQKKSSDRSMEIQPNHFHHRKQER